jgi:hypothetical protein
MAKIVLFGELIVVLVCGTETEGRYNVEIEASISIQGNLPSHFPNKAD